MNRRNYWPAVLAFLIGLGWIVGIALLAWPEGPNR